jgi:glutaconate CoA-transferase subunit A
MRDKRLSEEDVVAELRDGMTIGIGGWGSRRKPMSIIRAIVRSDLKDLTIVAYGGADVGLLCAAGKVKKVMYAFVSLDSIPLDPHFRAARQKGIVEDEPYDEGLYLLGLQAAAWRVPFLPSRVGLGSDLLTYNSKLKLITSPFEDGEELVAVPALKLDAAICHLSRSDQRGNAIFLNADLYFDDLYLRAADKRFISVEEVVPTEQLRDIAGTELRMRVNRSMVDGVVERPHAAHFTECPPDYGRDEAFQKEYATAASSEEAWQAFRKEWLDISEDEYQSKVGSR